jgi:hypothetical protein
MSGVLGILLPVLAGLIVLFAVVRLVVGYFGRKFNETIKKKFAGKQIVRQSTGANFFGQSSRGVGQIRGNGALVLTPSELYFIMFVPRKELTIPLQSVTSVSTPRSHLGKTVGWRLLRVDYRSPSGEDAAAWAVQDVDEWASSVERYQHQ